MFLSKFKFKSIGLVFFVIIFLFTQHVKSLDKFNNDDSISNYFSGILAYNESEYNKSFKFLKKLDGLESSYPDYSVKYLYSLINSGNFREAFNFSKKLIYVDPGILKNLYKLKKNATDRRFKKKIENSRKILV